MTDGSLGQSCDKHHSPNQRPKSNRDPKHCDRTHASLGDWITFSPDHWLWRGESRGGSMQATGTLPKSAWRLLVGVQCPKVKTQT